VASVWYSLLNVILHQAVPMSRQDSKTTLRAEHAQGRASAVSIIPIKLQA